MCDEHIKIMTQQRVEYDILFEGVGRQLGQRNFALVNHVQWRSTYVIIAKSLEAMPEASHL